MEDGLCHIIASQAGLIKDCSNLHLFHFGMPGTQTLCKTNFCFTEIGLLFQIVFVKRYCKRYTSAIIASHAADCEHGDQFGGKVSPKR